MKNKEIQEQRMRGYFIEATRNMLKAEGLKSLSVRSIAEKAGYSYATLYNYFKDIKDLIFHCVHDFHEEIKQVADAKSAQANPGIESLKERIKAYALYFVEYPGIFELFFVERLGDLGHKRQTLDVVTYGLDRLCEKDWQYIHDKNILNESQIEYIQINLRFALPGMLLFYLNRLTPSDYMVFREQLDRYIEQLFE